MSTSKNLRKRRNSKYFNFLNVRFLLLFMMMSLLGSTAFSQLEPDSQWEKEVANFDNGNFSISYFGLSVSNEREYKGRDNFTSDSVLIVRNRLNSAKNTTISYSYHHDGHLLSSIETCLRGQYCITVYYSVTGVLAFIEQIDLDGLKDGWQIVYNENGLPEETIFYKHGKKSIDDK